MNKFTHEIEEFTDAPEDYQPRSQKEEWLAFGFMILAIIAVAAFCYVYHVAYGG